MVMTVMMLSSEGGREASFGVPLAVLVLTVASEPRKDDEESASHELSLTVDTSETHFTSCLCAKQHQGARPRLPTHDPDTSSQTWKHAMRWYKGLGASRNSGRG